MNVVSKIGSSDHGLSAPRLDRIRGWMQHQVDAKKLAGLISVVSRRGQVALMHCCGQADIERGKPMRPDTIFRIYSMTKPLTSVAIMMLYEEGRFQLDDPIHRYLPAFKNMRVAVGGMRGKIESEPAQRDINFRDLLSHTSGLTYGFMEATPVDALYRERGVDFQTAKGSLREVVDLAASMPLIAQPGAEWNYSIATDVLGCLVEVISGKSLDAFMQERILAPLGMVDTSFHVPAGKVERFAANYGPAESGGLKLLEDPQKNRFLSPRLCSGGGGLLSTAADYMRFCQMLLNKGELEGARLLGRKTVELMASNHLNGDMADMGQPRFSESTYTGIGFGLGFSVMLDPAKAQILGTPGEFAWGGAASTAFWVDPAEEMYVLLLTQLMPSSTYPIRRELRVLSYQAIVD
ncbi:MAG TPA: serine hydrolase domain-containing protein [Vineibacter sp.]|nr:serine hydrolase domain-containing protein [Vineibacter sp.]